MRIVLIAARAIIRVNSRRLLSSSSTTPPKDGLTPQQFEHLWRDQDARIRTDFNEDEFRLVVDNLHALSLRIRRSLNIETMITRAIYSNICQSILSPKTDGDTPTPSKLSLIEKLKTTSDNWSIIFDNVGRVMSLVTDLPLPANRRGSLRTPVSLDLVLNSLYVDIYRGLSTLQSTHVPAQLTLFAELNADLIDLDSLKLNAQLLASYFEYSTRVRPELKQSGAVLRPAIRTYLLYIDFYLLVHKKTLKSDPVDASIEPFLNSTRTLTRLLISQFNGMDSIHEDNLNEFFRFFSFDETLWAKSARWLIQHSRTSVSTSVEGAFTPALRGRLFVFDFIFYFYSIFLIN